MADLSSLRQHGSFPGALVGILEEHEARLAALEAHKQETAPIVATYQKYEAERLEHETRAAAPAVAQEAAPAEKPAEEETEQPADKPAKNKKKEGEHA